MKRALLTREKRISHTHWSLNWKLSSLRSLIVTEQCPRNSMLTKKSRRMEEKQTKISHARALKGGAVKKRLEGAGRKVTDVDVEEKLLNCIHECRENKLRVSRKLIMRKAKMFFDESVGDDECAKEALLEVRRLTESRHYTSQSVISMDETAVWADMVSRTTVDKVGAREICLKTTGHEKVRISGCLSAKADGTKLKPFIVFGGAKREATALHKEFHSRCIVTSSSNAWMNEDLTLQYVESVIGKFSFAPRLLAWDSFQCHLMDSVKKQLNDSKVDSIIIPGGCTKYLQAPNVF